MIGMLVGMADQLSSELNQKDRHGTYIKIESQLNPRFHVINRLFTQEFIKFAIKYKLVSAMRLFDQILKINQY